MKKTNPPPIFIMGCQRSGTTLLARILDSHSRIAVYLGTHYYVLFGPHRHLYGDIGKPSNRARLVEDFREAMFARNVSPPQREAILDEMTDPTFDGVLGAFLRLHARSERKPRSADKTPEHYLHLNWILEDFPDSPVIFTMRDPRDNVMSIRKGMGTTLDGSIQAWNGAYSSYKGASRPVYLSRYEDLVTDPERALESMCDFLGEAFEPQMLEFFRDTPSRFRSLPHHRRLFGKVDSRSVGKFTEMPAPDVERIEAGCQVGMSTMGYPFTAGRAKPAALVHAGKRGMWGFVVDRLRYYRTDRERWRRGLTHWKSAIRLRLRYLLLLGPLRRDF